MVGESRENLALPGFGIRADKFEDQFEGAGCPLADAERYDEPLGGYYSDRYGGVSVRGIRWRKRLSFEYEHEVRVRDITEGGLSPTPPEFILLPVSLEELIDSVYVFPMAESWLKDVEVDGLKKYGLGKGGSFRDGGTEIIVNDLYMGEYVQLYV